MAHEFVEPTRQGDDAMTGPLPPSSRADAAMSLVLAAAGAERRNRPRTLVLFAALLLAAAGIYALLSYRTLSAARGAIAFQQQQTRTIKDLDASITAIEEKEARLVFEPDPRVASKLEELGKEVGLENEMRVEQTSGSVAGTKNIARKVYTPKAAPPASGALRSIEIAPLVAWLTRACDGSVVQGLMPTSIKIKALRTGPTDKPAGPGEADWELDARFSRIERDERGS